MLDQSPMFFSSIIPFKSGTVGLENECHFYEIPTYPDSYFWLKFDERTKENGPSFRKFSLSNAHFVREYTVIWYVCGGNVYKKGILV